MTPPPDRHILQRLAPLCRFCQSPLIGGTIFDVSINESLETPPRPNQINTITVVECGNCGVQHKVFVGTSLRECRCVAVPFEASESEAKKFLYGDAVDEDDVLDAVRVLKSGKFMKAVAVWAGKRGSR